MSHIVYSEKVFLYNIVAKKLLEIRRASCRGIEREMKDKYSLFSKKNSPPFL